jgi:hypothetical protein
MGRAQGEACRDGIASALAAAGIARPRRIPTSLLPFAGGPVLGRGMGLQVVRHYPHLSERIQGLARGSGQSAASLMELFVRAAGGAGPESLTAPAAGAGRSGDAACLLRRVAPADWIVRRSRPEVGFASVELTLPWLATAVGGVNENGVAVLVVPTRAPRPDAGGPSVLLLVQECLQRFHDVPGCIDWCSKRPASGAASIVLADGTGAVAAVEVDDDVRRVVTPADGVLASGGEAAEQEALLERFGSSAVAEPGDGGGELAIFPNERALEVALGPDRERFPVS